MIVYKATPSDRDAVVHWRTKGSKNGVRVWQNEDGSYTEAGKNYKPGGRYSQADGYSDAADKTSSANPTAKNSGTSGSSGTSKSSDSESVQFKTERPSGVDRTAKSRSLSQMSTNPKRGERLTGQAISEAYSECDVVRVKEGGSTLRKNGGLENLREKEIREQVFSETTSNPDLAFIGKEYAANNKFLDSIENKYTTTDVVDFGDRKVAVEYTDWFSACDSNMYKDSAVEAMNRKCDAAYENNGLLDTSKMNATERNIYYTSMATYLGLAADPDGWTPTTYAETGKLSSEYQNYLDSYFSNNNVNGYLLTVAYNGGNFDAIKYASYVESQGLQPPKNKYK